MSMSSQRDTSNDKEQPWYKRAWGLEIEDMPWAQNTLDDVEFVSQTLNLSGQERILDMACGIGRHAIELARRGHSVVAVDLSPELIDRGRVLARSAGVEVEFLRADIRDLSFREEFDVVLNLWEGGIGYLENDEENLKVFRVISRALKLGGQHLAGPIINADFARKHFPIRMWEKSKKMIMLSELQWLDETSEIIDASWRLKRTPGGAWRMDEGARTGCYRLYSPSEISSILTDVGLSVVSQYEHRDRKPSVCDEDMEFWIHSVKVGKVHQ